MGDVWKLFLVAFLHVIKHQKQQQKSPVDREKMLKQGLALANKGDEAIANLVQQLETFDNPEVSEAHIDLMLETVENELADEVSAQLADIPVPRANILDH